MRLWSLHPSLLDRQGLTALWRESLLAQAVLAGRTAGYRRHPQLVRFAAASQPLGAVAHYLDAVAEDADLRGYHFDRSRIDDVERLTAPIPVTRGQRDLELRHLRAKLEARSPAVAAALPAVEPPLHPSFVLVEGAVEPWERAGR